MATITTRKQHPVTLFGFPVWAWATIAVIFAITTTVLVVALTRDAPVDPAINAATLRYEALADHWAELERQAAIQRANAAATERLGAQAEVYRALRANEAAAARLTAQAEAYLAPQVAQQAATARLNGLAESYGAINPGLDAWAARYQGLAESLSGLTAGQQALADRYTALAESYGG